MERDAEERIREVVITSEPAAPSSGWLVLCLSVLSLRVSDSAAPG
jgi:hypothetical protein